MKNIDKLVNAIDTNNLEAVKEILDPIIPKNLLPDSSSKDMVNFLYTPQSSFINEYTNDGMTPLMYAIKKGVNKEIINYLIESGADINAKYDEVYNILIPAIKSNNYQLALEIKNEKGIEMNDDDIKTLNEKLNEIASYSHFNKEEFKLLLELGADIHAVDSDGKTILQKIIEDDEDLENEEDFEDDEDLENEEDLEHGKAVIIDLIIKELVKSGGLSDSEKSTLNEELHKIANSSYYMDEKKFKALLDLGADIHSVDSAGKTILQKAIESKEYHKVITIQEELGGLNNLSDKDKSTLNEQFHKIRSNDMHYILEIEALSKLIDINSIGKNGNTLLISSILAEDNELFDTLLKEGADINAQNTQNMYPLDIAFESRNKHAAKKLYNKEGVLTNIKNIEESFLYAEIKESSKKGYPYFKALKREIQLAHLNSEGAFELLKDGRFKSLYFRVKKLDLNEELSNFIDEAQKSGIKEILIFCDKDESSLSKKQFEDFIRDAKVRINFNVLPVTADDIKKIRKDKFGKEDILAIKKINDYEFSYRNRHIIESLRSEESDNIILLNHNEHNYNVMNNLSNEYIPQHILEDDSNNALSDQEEGISFEITHNQEQDQQLSVNLNKEVNVDKNQKIAIDEAQMLRKCNRFNARLKSIAIEGRSFSDAAAAPKKFTNHAYSEPRSSDTIDAIFDSNSKIQYITEDAIAMIMDNKKLFQAGINIDNTPIGLAFTDGTIFKSNKRPEWMPINEFTIRLDHITPTFESPLGYSLLQFASIDSLTPSKLYGTSLAPAIRGQNTYQGPVESSSSLGYPHYAKTFSYTVNPINQLRKHRTDIPDELLLERQDIKLSKHFDLRFSNIIDNNDKITINNIYKKLKKEGLIIRILILL